MALDPFTFGVESRPGKYGPTGGGRIINGYVEKAPEGSPVPFHVYCRPGLGSFSTLIGAGGWRGGLEFGAYGLVVVGRALHQVDSTGTVINTWGFAGDAPVWMARNRKQPNAQVALCSEGERFIWNAGNLINIADTDLLNAICVFSQGGYFIWLLPDGRFQISQIDEGTDYDALDFATAEANPDGLVGGCERGEEIILAGPKSIEFHVNRGGGDFPYERVQGSTLSLGCIAGHSLKSVNGVPIFAASDYTVRLLDGYSPNRISNHDVERAIEALIDKSKLEASIFNLEGHQFYALSSPDWTWVCDLLTKTWVEYSSNNTTGRWRASGAIEIAGKRIMGDYADPALYEFTPSAHDDAGEHLIWKLISAQFGNFPARETVDELYVNLLPGVGLNSTDGHEADPVAMLRISDDDGFTWSDQMEAPVGKIGEKKAQTSFTNLGTSEEDGFRFELSMSAPVARAWTGSAIRHTPQRP